MITVIIGKSASGKDTLLKKMVKEGSKPIVSYTTRPMRVGEADGVDYHFVTDHEFSKLISEGVFFEYRYYDTLVEGKPERWWYGSPVVDKNDDYVVVLDVKGCLDYIEGYKPPYVKVIYLKVDDDVRKERAQKRGSFDETEWERRRIDDRKKFSCEEISKVNNLFTPYLRTIEIIDNN